jgi:hypothetical protein
MGEVPGYAAAVWFDTYVRPKLGGERTVEKMAEGLFSRFHQGLFDDLATMEGEFELHTRTMEASIMAVIMKAVIQYGKPVSNRYCGREVTELELENLKLEKLGPQPKEDESGALGVG